MLSPGLATAEIHKSKEHEHPEQSMTSSAVILSPICSATAFRDSKNLKNKKFLNVRICMYFWQKVKIFLVLLAVAA